MPIYCQPGRAIVEALVNAPVFMLPSPFSRQGGALIQSSICLGKSQQPDHGASLAHDFFDAWGLGEGGTTPRPVPSG